VKSGVLRPLPDTLILAALLLARVAWLIWKRLKAAKTMPHSKLENSQL
jgi:hypothetical protein